MRILTGFIRRSSLFFNTLLTFTLLQFGFLSPVHADFINGNFEAPYDTSVPMSGITYNTIVGWTLQGYKFSGAYQVPPKSLQDINLKPSPPPPGPINTLNGISDIIIGPTESIYDYFLLGAVANNPDRIIEQRIPIEGNQSAAINVRWQVPHTPYAKSGTGKINGWISVGQQATSIQQTITITDTDFDPYDHSVHVRFKAAPVLENPNHKASEQPFIAVQLNNLTPGYTGPNPLYFIWNYAGQPSVPWTTLSKKGSNPGSNITYEFTDWQAFDINPGNAYIREGDQIQLVVLASGCSPNGHDGHLYLDAVSTQLPNGLWVKVTGPETATPGENITYTYTYYNVGTTTINNVQVLATMPLPQYAALPNTTLFVSVPQSPTVGTDSYCTTPRVPSDPVTCFIGTLEPGQSGQFQMTVNIPARWPTTAGPVNNGYYPISGDNALTVNGPLWQTELLLPPAQSYLTPDASGLTAEQVVGTSYAGNFTCTNTAVSGQANADAINATCVVTGLPDTLSVSGCTISPSAATWDQLQVIPLGQTVTCSVTGTLTTPGVFPVTVTTNADNNTSPPNNIDSTYIEVKQSPPQYVVTPLGDGFESYDPPLPVIVDAGTPTSFTVMAHVDFELSLTVGGTCPAGTWNGSTYTTGSVNANCTVIFNAKPIITGNFDSNPVHACCGRPILLNPLRITGGEPTVFTVVSTTGDAHCVIGQSGSQAYVKAFGSNGTCTIVGTKKGVTSIPLTIIV